MPPAQAAKAHGSMAKQPRQQGFHTNPTSWKREMSDIIWPAGFVPGFVDNFCSNELIVSGLGVTDLWPLLNEPGLWPGYYDNAQDIRIHDAAGPCLAHNVRFFFMTFGFPIEAQVLEHISPVPGQPARLAWHGWAGENESRIDAYHAWLLEDLSADRVRILTQETQIGLPARELAGTLPNPMINAHQAWVVGLVAAARAAKVAAAST